MAERSEWGDSALQAYRWMLAGGIAYMIFYFERNEPPVDVELIMALMLVLLFLADLSLKGIIYMVENRTLDTEGFHK